MKSIHLNDVELNKILIPHTMLIQQNDYTVYQCRTVKYNSIVQGDFSPLVVQIDNISNHNIDETCWHGSKIILSFPCIDKVEEIINYINNIFSNEGITLEKPIHNGRLHCTFEKTLTTKQRFSFIDNLKNPDQLYFQYVKSPQFTHSTMIFEKYDNDIKQIDTVFCDFNKIVSSPFIKILMRFDIERENKNHEKKYRLAVKIECLEYSFTPGYQYDTDDPEPLTVEEIREKAKNITVWI